MGTGRKVAQNKGEARTTRKKENCHSGKLERNTKKKNWEIKAILRWEEETDLSEN